MVLEIFMLYASFSFHVLGGRQNVAFGDIRDRVLNSLYMDFSLSLILRVGSIVVIMLDVRISR